MSGKKEVEITEETGTDMTFNKANDIAKTYNQGTAQINPMTIIEKAIESNISPDNLEKLMQLQERWQANEAKKAFDLALSQAKPKLPIIYKKNKVEFGTTKYQFEDLAGISKAITPILSEHGLSFRWNTASDVQGMVTVSCIISHEMGHSETNTLTAPADSSGKKNAIQSIGSSVTYLQRYTIKAALGLAASADDDANVNPSYPDDRFDEMLKDKWQEMLDKKATTVTKIIQMVQKNYAFSDEQLLKLEGLEDKTNDKVINGDNDGK